MEACSNNGEPCFHNGNDGTDGELNVVDDCVADGAFEFGSFTGSNSATNTVVHN